MGHGGNAPDVITPAPGGGIRKTDHKSSHAHFRTPRILGFNFQQVCESELGFVNA